VTDPTHRAALEVLLAAADAVGEVLAATSDWGPSGRRSGQYAVDLAADEACLEPLRSAGYRILSEESGLHGTEGPLTVVVDPLDGSTNASRGIPWFATALCVVDGDGPAVACVVNHATNERFTAVRGDGARRNDEPIAPTGCRLLADAIVGLSGVPSHHYGWAQFRALGAAAPDICAVGSGVLDAWCDMTDDAHGAWDYLAAVSICAEAGAVAVDARGRGLTVLDPRARRTPIVAASPELLDDLLAHRLAPVVADRRTE
jgi:myo-inositol-1(or 4)-monophosphatase